MKNDLISFTLRLSEMQIIKSALDHLEEVALKTFNESNFGSLEQILQRAEAYTELRQLKKMFQVLIEMKLKENDDEKI